MTTDPRRPRNIPRGDIPRRGAPVSRRSRVRMSRDVRSRRSHAVDDLLAISWRLEPRDYVIALLLTEHQFLTTDQIAAVLFASTRTCRNRLNTLRRLGFLDWFMPVHSRRGRLPVHWVPGPLAVRYVSLYHGEPVPSSRTLRDARDSHPAVATYPGHLAHTDGIHQFFVDLLVHTRTHPGTRLDRWWSAGTTYQKVNHNTRPDGHGVWTDGDQQVAFFLEHDMGTETHAVRAAKLVGYHTLGLRGPSWPVLFWLPTSAVEANLHHHLAHRTGGSVDVTVATAARDHAADNGGPAGPVWALVGGSRERLRLGELPGPVGPAGAYHPGPPEPREEPLYLLRSDTGPAPA